MSLNTQPDQYAEDKEGFIDLHVKIHRDDVRQMLRDDNQKPPYIGKKLLRLIAAIMHDSLSGGDNYYDDLRAAYERATEAE